MTSRPAIVTVFVTMTLALSAAGLLVKVAGEGQPSTGDQAGTPAVTARDDALRATRLAEQFERDARVLTVFDRQGKIVTTVGEAGIYSRPVFSPDRTRLAVVKSDLANETQDLWILDISGGKNTRITSNLTQRQERVSSPVWSPDGSQVAFVALRASYWGLYRKASNGEGTEELLYQHPGANLVLTDWSMDGGFLGFSTTDLSGGTLYTLPLAGGGERPSTGSGRPEPAEGRKPVVVLRGEYQLWGSSISPDGRLLSYMSNQSGKTEVHVRPFDPSASAAAKPAAGPWQVSGQGSRSPGYWRRDGKELYYLAADRGLMAVDVSTTPTFKSGKPRLLFRLSEAVPVVTNLLTSVADLASFSRDGQRVVIAVPHAPVLQQIAVFDRQGKLLSKVGPPARYRNPEFSPDGRRVAVMRNDPQSGSWDIWTFDVASGKGTPVTNDVSPDMSAIWSPDGSRVGYVSWRGALPGIYRKSWDGTGSEEQLLQFRPGEGGWLTDWSADGRFLAFDDDCSTVLHVLPLPSDQKVLERKAIEWLRDEYSVYAASFSPDSRFIAYLSRESKTAEETRSNIAEVYVRSFDPAKSDVSAGDEKPVQVTTTGARGRASWRQDGKEMYYLTGDWEVMAVDVVTAPTFQAGTRRPLFRLPGPFVVGGVAEGRSIVSRDGQRFVFTINVPAPLTAR